MGYGNLEVALEMVEGEALDAHDPHDRLGSGFCERIMGYNMRFKRRG